MIDTAANAQPATPEVAGGQTAPETTSQTPAPASDAASSTSSPSYDDELSRIYDAAQEPKSPPAQEAQAEPISDQPAKVEPEPGQSSPAIAAPHSWSADAKALWATLPPDAQRVVAQRESEAHRAITQMGNELKAYQPLRDVYSTLNTWGVPQGREAEVINSWARAQQFLDSNPLEGLKWLAQSYKVDLAQLSGQGVQQTPQSSSVDDLFRDPRLDQQVLPEVRAMKEQVARLQGQLTARERAEVQQRESTAQEVINQFANGKEDWADLMDEVTAEVAIIKQREPNASMQDLLQRAYDRARWANPTNRQRILDTERKAAEEKALKDAQKAAAEAKKHAALNVRTGASASTPTFDGKWDDNSKLEALYDRISAR
jgi:hypothetical protein